MHILKTVLFWVMRLVLLPSQILKKTPSANDTTEHEINISVDLEWRSLVNGKKRIIKLSYSREN